MTSYHSRYLCVNRSVPNHRPVHLHPLTIRSGIEPIYVFKQPAPPSHFGTALGARGSLPTLSQTFAASHVPPAHYTALQHSPISVIQDPSMSATITNRTPQAYPLWAEDSLRFLNLFALPLQTYLTHRSAPVQQRVVTQHSKQFIPSGAFPWNSCVRQTLLQMIVQPLVSAQLKDKHLFPFLRSCRTPPVLSLSFQPHNLSKASPLKPKHGG